MYLLILQDVIKMKLNKQLKWANVVRIFLTNTRDMAEC